MTSSSKGATQMYSTKRIQGLGLYRRKPENQKEQQGGLEGLNEDPTLGA